MNDMRQDIGGALDPEGCREGARAPGSWRREGSGANSTCG